MLFDISVHREACREWGRKSHTEPFLVFVLLTDVQIVLHH